MTDLRIQAVIFDSRDPSATASFWEAALGWRRTYEKPDEVVIEPPAGQLHADMLFVRVPAEKAVKNRLHLDLRPKDQAAEVARLEALGARRVDVGQGAGKSWVVMTDPEGNEFCVLRPYTAEEQAQLDAAG